MLIQFVSMILEQKGYNTHPRSEEKTGWFLNETVRDKVKRL